MSNEPEELDRVVSRRVDHPTEATDDDERAYRAAAPSTEPEADTDTDTGGSGGAAERASRDMDGPDEDDEPTRSE